MGYNEEEGIGFLMMDGRGMDEFILHDSFILIFVVFRMALNTLFVII